MVGKSLRIAKFFRTTTRRACIFPIDHGLTLGPVEGLINPYQTIASLLSGGADAIVLHKGILERFANYPNTLTGNYLLHVSASTAFSPESREKCIVGTVEDAVRLGAVGVSVHVNLGGTYENQMLRDMGVVSSACAQWGMPLLAMMYVSATTREEGPSGESRRVAHAARIAEELGADIVKVPFVSEMRCFNEVIKGVSIPVLVAGGQKSDDPRQFFSRLDDALVSGGSGVAVGRNIFQSPNVTLMASLTCQLVHGQISLQDCLLQAEDMLKAHRAALAHRA